MNEVDDNTQAPTNRHYIVTKAKGNQARQNQLSQSSIWNKTGDIQMHKRDGWTMSKKQSIRSWQGLAKAEGLAEADMRP